MKDFMLAVMFSVSMFSETLVPRPVPVAKGMVLYAHNVGRSCVYTIRMKDKTTTTISGPCNLQPGDSVTVKLDVVK